MTNTSINALSVGTVLGLAAYLAGATLALSGHDLAPTVLAAAMRDLGPAGKSALVTLPCIFALAGYCGALIYTADTMES